MCIKCDGTGYIIENNPPDGKAPRAVPCERCGHALGVPRALWLARKQDLFENQLALFNRIVEWLRTPLWAFTICSADGLGNVGTGKTHVLATFANEAHIRNYQVLFVNLMKLLEEESEARKVKEPSVILPLAEERGILIIDEFGVDNAYERETVERMMRHRYERRLRTIVATNLDWATLEESYPRVASALSEGVVVRWAGPDLRPTIKQRMLEAARGSAGNAL